MRRCCYYRASGGRDHREPYAIVGGTSREDLLDGCGAQSGKEGGVIAVYGCRSRPSQGRDDDASDEVVVDEDVEGGEGSGGLEWPCWMPGQM